MEEKTKNIDSAKLRKLPPWWKRHWRILLLAVLALVFVAYVGRDAWKSRGVRIAIHFDHGHGIRPGAPLKYRGIVVGEVEEVELHEKSGVQLRLVVSPKAQTVLREQTLFWIVRPELAIHGVAGLDTLLGPRYVAVLPGDGKPSKKFVGSEEAFEILDPEALRIILKAKRVGSLRQGAPIKYRGIPIGKITSVGLSPNGSEVLVQGHVAKGHKPLVTTTTRFRNASGVRIGMNFSRGAYLDTDSIQTLITGGVTMFAAAEKGKPAADGQEYTLEVDTLMADDSDGTTATWSGNMMTRIKALERFMPGGE